MPIDFSSSSRPSSSAYAVNAFLVVRPDSEPVLSSVRKIPAALPVAPLLARSGSLVDQAVSAPGEPAVPLAARAEEVHRLAAPILPCTVRSMSYPS